MWYWLWSFMPNLTLFLKIIALFVWKSWFFFSLKLQRNECFQKSFRNCFFQASWFFFYLFYVAGYSFETTQSVSHNTLKPALQSWLPTYVAWSKSTTTWKLQAINGLLSKRDTTNDAPLYLPMYLTTYVYLHKFFQKCCSQQLRKKNQQWNASLIFG